MKIYTRKGDDGTTGLWYGGRVPKHDGRPEAYGSVDEAASALGLARAAAERGGELYADILRVQNELFVAGAELATAPEAAERLEAGVSKVTAEMVERLESDIDRYMERVDLPPKFVIPGAPSCRRAWTSRAPRCGAPSAAWPPSRTPATSPTTSLSPI